MTSGEQQPRRVRPTPAAAVVVSLQARLDGIAELHDRGVSGWCAACLLEHPCPTYRLATMDPE